jgi:hypothetical protein
MRWQNLLIVDGIGEAAISGLRKGLPLVSNPLDKSRFAMELLRLKSARTSEDVG